MPYVVEEKREPIRFLLAAFKDKPLDPGELSYAITYLVICYVKRVGKSYFNCAVVCGVLLLTMLEFIRRIVFKYEDKKIAENGDVYQELED